MVAEIALGANWFAQCVETSCFQEARPLQNDGFAIDGIVWRNLFSVNGKMNALVIENGLQFHGSIAFVVVDGFNKWQILNKYLGGTLIVCGGWNNEVEYVENWLSDRIIWFNSYVSQL